MDKPTLPADELTASIIETVTTLRHTRTVVEVTPDIAARLLATIDLDDSRALMGGQVRHLAWSMRDGDFDFLTNHADALTLDSNGRLRNGKQRLVALIMAGVTGTFAMCVDDRER